MADDSELGLTAVADYWNGNAEQWSEHVRQGWDVYREYLNNPAFLEFIGDLNGKTVLDAGCGEGYNTRILSERGAHVTGVDISEKMLELAREAERREPRGIRYEVASFNDLSLFHDGAFDVVVSFMALMDSPEFTDAVREFFRVLKPGGRLCFNITHPCFLTRGFGWQQDADGTGLHLTVSDYFDKQPYVDRWKFSQSPIPETTEPFAIPCYPRTMTEYINTVIETGFTLKKIGEPRPSPQVCEKHRWLERWRRHAAIFFYVCAEKESVR